MNLLTHAQSVQPITADWATGERGLDTNQSGLKDAEIGFAEINSVRLRRGISNIQACNPILVVPPNAIMNHKKSMILDL